MFKLKIEQSDVLHTKWGTARIKVKNRGLEWEVLSDGN